MRYFTHNYINRKYNVVGIIKKKKKKKKKQKSYIHVFVDFIGV